MEDAPRTIIENAVEIFVAGALRRGVLHDHVMVGELLPFGEVKPVQNALQPVAREVRVNGVPGQPRAQRERVGVHPAAPPELAVHRRHVERLTALVLKLHVLDHRLVARDQLRDGVCEIGRVHRANVKFHDSQPALFFRDNQVARVSGGAGLFDRRGKNQLNRLGHNHAFWHVDKGAVEEKRRVERGKRGVFRAHVASQVLLQQRGLGDQRGGQAANLHPVRQGANG